MDATLNPKKRRGQELAKGLKLKHKGPFWVVPSQTSTRQYIVDSTPEHPSCTCKSFEDLGEPCKHIWAVRCIMTGEVDPSPEPPKIKYKQQWPAYNLAQTTEKDRVAELLSSLCEGLVEPPQQRGRPRIPIGEAIFAAVMKVYGTTSGRRSMSDMRVYQERGFIKKVPHFNSISNTLEDPALIPILTNLIRESAAPLKAIEHDFAADSSGFSTTTYRRWFDAKYGKEKTKQKWIKAHIMTGVITNVITSVEITDAFTNDYTPFTDLVQDTAKRFSISEISADKGYIGQSNLEVVNALGATPFIPFKSNATGEGSELWKKTFHYFMFNREEFKKRYHKRSNVETTFSMVKNKFGAFVRSKDDVAQINEVLCKILCHNLCVLIQCIYELGIEPEFWKEEAA